MKTYKSTLLFNGILLRDVKGRFNYYYKLTKFWIKIPILIVTKIMASKLACWLSLINDGFSQILTTVLYEWLKFCKNALFLQTKFVNNSQLNSVL